MYNRLGFYIHGGIDGHSRKIVYMVCNANNKASTVFSNFISAINTQGLPLKVRGDQGVENVDVAWFMLTNRHILFLVPVAEIKELNVYGETYM